MSLVVHARFLRNLSYASQPRLYAQLNAFTQVTYAGQYGAYLELLKLGTVAEIDNALREGTISPFHVDEYGDSSCLYVSTFLLFVGAQRDSTLLMPWFIGCGISQTSRCLRLLRDPGYRPI